MFDELMLNLAIMLLPVTILKVVYICTWVIRVAAHCRFKCSYFFALLAVEDVSETFKCDLFFEGTSNFLYFQSAQLKLMATPLVYQRN